ncbi:MAG: hypothetical protein H0U43_09560, partial [Chthoniobacterales bacterium]|nr:hypothetical protein [Chthoniobacterales bacterium]
HMTAVSGVAQLAAEPTVADGELRAHAIGLLLHPTGGLLVLLAAMLLSVIKPWGLTSYGRRGVAQPATSRQRSADSVVAREPIFAIFAPRWPKLIKIHAIHAVILLLLLLVAWHLNGGAMPHH